MNRRIIGLICLGAAMVLVGSTVVASKVIGSGMPPFTATALRFAISTPVLLGIFWLTRERWPRLPKRDWVILFIQAAAGSVAYTVLLLLGLSYTPAANAGVILGTLPVVMGLLAIVAFREPVTLRFTVALIAASAGVLMIVLRFEGGGVSALTPKDAMGVSLILAAVACEALFLLLQKKLSKPVPARVLSALMSILGLALATGPACIELAAMGEPSVSSAAIWAVVYYALVPTVLGFFLWYEGASRTSAGEAALITAVLPVSALVLAGLVLHESISVRQSVGCGLVACAILAGTVRARKSSHDASRKRGAPC